MGTKAKWLSVAVLAMALGCSGCWLLEGGPKTAAGRVDAALQSLDENLPAARVEAANNAEKLQGWSEQAEGVATVASTLPGPQQPYVKGAAVILGIATSVLTWISTKLKRKSDVTELALDSVIVAVDGVPKIGGKINREAVANGNGAADKVKERYDAVIAVVH